MAPRRDRWRVGAASATLSAGALVFFAAGTGPVSADTRAAAAGVDECKLGKLLCGILSVGKGTPTAPPKASSGGTSTKPSTKPSSKPGSKPKPAARPAPPPSHDDRAGDQAGVPPPPVEGVAPEVPVPESSQAPALPDVAGQDPVVLPVNGGQAPPARLVAESAPDDGTVPPLLVATASGLIGAVATLNLSVLRRRRHN